MVSVSTPGALNLSADDDGIARDRGPCPASFEKNTTALEIPSHALAQFHPRQNQRLQADDGAESRGGEGGEREESGVGKMTPETICGSEAAAAVQKVYRSYRTRRRLADCAVMSKEIEWWNVLEGALLKHRSETFYAYEEQDTAASRWSRLEKKAAKVGKGLSKDENARKLAIQHWLEAIDPRHRYGHNLHLYYKAWEKRPTKEPFFYWLDVGEGKEVDLPDCKRSKLQKQQIRYLGPVEREQYEVLVAGGKLQYKKSGELVNTPKENKWIFVMSASGRLYVAQKDKGSFQHSSFLAGAATKAAGRLLVRNGILELMEAHSGHYHPTEENFDDLLKVLKDLGTDLGMAKVQKVSDDTLLLENENLQKFSSRQMYEVNVTTKEHKPDFLNLCEGQINESEVSTQVHPETKLNKDSEAMEEKENPAKSLSTKGGAQDPPNLLLSSNGFQCQLPDEIILNTDPHVRVEIESKGILGKITISDKPAEITSSVCEELNEEESAKMVLFQPAETEHVRKWTSGAGPCIASLADMPQETFLKALEDVEKPFGTSA